MFFQVEKTEKYKGEVDKITLAAYEGEASLLAYVAEEYGFFEQNGLAVTIHGFESGKAAADELINEEADIATSASGVLVSNSFERSDLRVLGTVSKLRVQGLIARKDRGITTASDLVGKKVGVTRKSHGEFNLGIFLIFNGISIEDIEIIDLKPGEIVNKIVSGEIDAGFTWEPNLYNAKAQLGDNALVIKENVPEFDFILLSKIKWLNSNQDAAKGFVKALIQAEDYTRDNEEEVRQFMKERFDYEQDYTISTWQDHSFEVKLSQPLLLQFEDIANWRIEHVFTDATKIPNYLDYIYVDALDEVKPESVGIIT